MEERFIQTPYGEIMILEDNGKLYFPATQCAEILGYQLPRKAVLDHCKEDGVLKRNVIDRLGRNQEMKFIDEGNLYRLIFSSKLPAAQKFERWVVDEVLPAIRNQGFYIDPRREIDPDVVINLCNQIKEQRRKLELALEDNHILEQQVHELAPKATYYDLILNCKDLIATTVIAKDYGMSARSLNKLLSEKGVQYFLTGQKIWCLKQDYADKGYMQTKTHNYLGNDGESHSKQSNYWTQKGRIFLYDFLKNLGILPIIERESIPSAKEI